MKQNKFILEFILTILFFAFFSFPLFSKTNFNLDYKAIYRNWKEFDPYTGIEERRIPLYQYLSIDFAYKENLSFYTDLFFEKDLSSGESAEYEVFSGYLNLHTASKKYQAKIGRHIINPGFHLVTIDGATLTGDFTDNFSVELYGGVPEFFEDDYRRYEVDDSRNGDYSVGTKLIISDFLVNRGTLNFYAEEENDREKRNITASIYKSLLKDYIAIDSMIEYEDVVERITNFRGAFNIYPTEDLTLSYQYSIYEPVNYEWEIKDEKLEDVSIFNIFAWHDKSKEHTINLQYDISENMTLFDEIAFISYEINDKHEEENARRFTSGIRFDFAPDLDLSSYFKYFYLENSFGDVQGAEVNLSTTFVKVLDVGLTLAGAWYDKLQPDLLKVGNYMINYETYTI
ncbi:hypothetical protein KKB18_05415, partial [bacterium]|nr:hypothetical protein [bacterium]